MKIIYQCEYCGMHGNGHELLSTHEIGCKILFESILELVKKKKKISLDLVRDSFPSHCGRVYPIIRHRPEFVIDSFDVIYKGECDE